MTDDETVIRELLQEWAKAVHQGDMPGVLMDHAKDIVMFDVPPPHDGRMARAAHGRVADRARLRRRASAR